MLFNPKPLSFVNSQVMVVLKSIIIKQWSHLIPIFLVHTECDVQEGDGICGPVGAVGKEWVDAMVSLISH